MSLEIIIPIAAVVILLLLFTWLVTTLKSTIKTVLVIVAIFVLLQVVFGIDSRQIVQEIVKIIDRLQQLLTLNPIQVGYLTVGYLSRSV